MKKILYFEGAGWEGADISKATVGNCRIRTAFHTDEGKTIYLELIGNKRQRQSSPMLYKWEYTGFVFDCFEITNDFPNHDCCDHQIKLPSHRSFEYSEHGILELVNSFGASFDAVKVLPQTSSYRVFPEKNQCQGLNGYNYGDEWIEEA